MAQYKNMFNVDLAKGNSPFMLRQIVGEGNNNANRIGVYVYEDGTAVNLGGSCTGRVIRPDGVTVYITGTIDGNNAYIVLDGESCAIPGNITVSIDWENDSNITTLLIAYGAVSVTRSSHIIPQGTPIDIDEVIAMVRAFTSGDYFHVFTTIITGDGTASEIADHANVLSNTLYRLQLTTPMSWLPSTYPTDASIIYFLSITTPFTLGRTAVTEVLLSDKMEVLYTRQRQPASENFDSWARYDSNIRTDDTIITGDGTASKIANHNNVKANTLYRLQLTTKMSWLPSDYVANGSIHFLIDVTHYYSANVGIIELILDEFMRIRWCRSAQPGGSFGSWYKEADGRFLINLSPGTNTIQDAVALAVYVGNADVVLLPGDHIITSFSGNGMTIGNNVRIIGTPDALIKAQSATGLQYYSPFYAGAGNFELNGVNITCKNVRYCVHDDPSAASAPTPAKHIYKNCSFYIDNTENNVWPNHQCIGGGMGMHTTIEAENCYFEAADPDAQLGLLSYHNNGEADAQGLIFVKDCEFAGNDGTARFGWYGASTKETKCYVVGCKMGHAPVIRAETQQSTNENMTLIEWGNVIGSAVQSVYTVDNDYTLVSGRDYLFISKGTGKTLLNAYLIGWDTDALLIKGFVDYSSSSYALFFSKSLSSNKSISIREVWATI